MGELDRASKKNFEKEHFTEREIEKKNTQNRLLILIWSLNIQEVKGLFG